MLRITRRPLINALSAGAPMRSHSMTQGDGDPVSSKEMLVRDFASSQLELIRLLKESSEIEHALMVQYLYASFSLKRAYGALAGMAYAGSSTIMGVAIQEMKHLHSVNKFLVSLGVLPNLHRQDFPYEPDIYPFEFNLEPLSVSSAAKYVYTESSHSDIDPNEPANHPELPFINRLYQVLGGNVRINHLGSLYQTIISVAEELESSGDLGFSIQSNIDEMRSIKDQGEKDHFIFFKSVFMGTHRVLAAVPGVWDLPKAHQDYPSYDLPKNPSAFFGHPNQIINERERQLAWLSNIHYWLILLLLHQSYMDQRNFPTLFDLAKEHMLSPLFSLGYALAEKNEGLPFDVLSLGYNVGTNVKSNAKVIQLLLREGMAIAKTIEGDLPGSFPTDIYINTLNKIDNLSLIL